MLWEWTRDSFRMKFLLQTPLHQIFRYITLTEPQKDGTPTSMVPLINLSRNRTAVQGAAPFHTPAPGRESTGQTNQSTMVIYFPAAWRAKCWQTKHLIKVRWQSAQMLNVQLNIFLCTTEWWWLKMLDTDLMGDTGRAWQVPAMLSSPNLLIQEYNLTFICTFFFWYVGLNFYFFLWILCLTAFSLLRY